jgi:hypothetical protein
MPNHYDLVAGDKATLLRVTVQDAATNAPIDLTGKTVQLRYSLNAGGTVEKSMTLRNQVSFPGQAEYTFLAADLTTGGTLIGEVRLQDGLSDQLTSVDQFHLSVKMPLPEPVP